MSIDSELEEYLFKGLEMRELNDTEKFHHRSPNNAFMHRQGNRNL